MESPSDRVDDDEVEDAVRGSMETFDIEVEHLNRMRAAYETRFWDNHPWAGIPGFRSAEIEFPVRVEVNQVWPFVATHVSNLAMRSPRVECELPAIVPTKAGRPADYSEAPAKVTAFGDEWIRHGDLQEVSTYALTSALFSGASAFKLGLRPKSKLVTNRVWVRAMPKWEAIWDDRASTWDQQSYRGHLRQERIDLARFLVQDPLEGVEGEPLDDPVLNFNRPMTSSLSTERHRLKKYVRLLEFYDLIAEEQRFYVVEGRDKSARVRPVGKAKPIPFEMANDRPGVTIVPLVLSNVPEYPLKGISAVSRVYQLNAEVNLLLTIIANGLRRDAARIAVGHEGGFPDQLVTAIKEAKDGTVVLVPKNINLDNLLRHIEWPGFSSTLDKYKLWLAEARQDSQGFSDLMQGRQGKYLSATEAEILAGSGESTAVEIGLRMSEAMGRSMELVYTMTASTMDEGERFVVRTTDGDANLTRKELELPWTVGILDAASTPVRDAKKKDGFLQVQPQMLELTKIASMDLDAQVPGPDGAPAPQPITPEVQRMAQLQLDQIVQLWGLPETMTWRSLKTAGEAAAAERKGARGAELKAKAEKLMPRVVDAMTGGGQPAPMPNGQEVP
jgi:hypothetical protein